MKYQSCFPYVSVPVLLKICLIFCITLSRCSSRDAGGSVKVAQPPVKSPFAGTWISTDSDRETAFKLVIVQEEDSLKGYYCLIKQNEMQSACQSPDAAQHGIAFVEKVPKTSGFSTELYSLRHQSLGYVQLTLTDSVLFWHLLRGPEDREFMIRQTTFRTATPLE